MAAASANGQEVPNKRVILKSYVTGFPTEDDMEVVTGTAPRRAAGVGGHGGQEPLRLLRPVHARPHD
ncbi:unnamed protein product [Miscanthus lutarioriparius]|uniref:Uncharacterized protein n=1 Tax=Miscanthus lutarioriparius TaxID=422564 RepID=A0A811RJQ6_9POAL|nr:unnamed protein product [Miscanthus lutarioriparius]